VVASPVLQLKLLIIPLRLLTAVAQKEEEKIDNISSHALLVLFKMLRINNLILDVEL
jgi:hypothetical protein